MYQLGDGRREHERGRADADERTAWVSGGCLGKMIDGHLPTRWTSQSPRAPRSLTPPERALGLLPLSPTSFRAMAAAQPLQQPSPPFGAEPDDDGAAWHQHQPHPPPTFGAAATNAPPSIQRNPSGNAPSDLDNVGGAHGDSKRRKSAATIPGAREGIPVPKKVKVGARASIACETCRRRKVRCSGEYPICNFCSQRSMTCTYDGHPDVNGSRSSGLYRRATPPPAPSIPAVFDFPHKIALRDAINALHSHFAEEGIVTFFHRPTLLGSIDNESYNPETMLCILAVAGRFCESIKHLHGSVTASCGIYAGQALAIVRQTPDDTSLARLHTYLLLALHDLTENEEQRGWMLLGNAIRLTQILKLGFLDEDDPAMHVPHSPSMNWKSDSVLTPPASMSSPHANRGTPGTPQATLATLELEMKRRTWWSCYLLERLFSDGRSLPAVLRADNITTRLPCADTEFITAKHVVTARFGAAPPPWGPLRELSSVTTMRSPAGPSRHSYSMSHGRPADDPEPDLYGQMMRVAELWSEVRTYIASGGRAKDRRAPWSKDSSFHTLDEKLSCWDSALPSHLQYSDANLTAHSMIGQGKLYGLMHSLYFASLVYLHRDYMPFVPPHHYNPYSGPVDGDPLWFPPEDDPAPPVGWWEESSKCCYRAAHTITNIFINLKSQGSELTNPFAGFAVLTAGTMHIHLACHWQQYGSPSEPPHEYLSSDTRILNDMRAFWGIAGQWCQALNTNYALNTLIHEGGAFVTPVSQPLHVVRAGVMKIFRTRDEDSSQGSTSELKTGSADLTEVLRKKHDLFSRLQQSPSTTDSTASLFLASHNSQNSSSMVGMKNSGSLLNDQSTSTESISTDLLATLPQLYTSTTSLLNNGNTELDPALQSQPAPPPPAPSIQQQPLVSTNVFPNPVLAMTSEEISLPMADWSALSMLGWNNSAVDWTSITWPSQSESPIM